jgi:hypothetical protein
MNRGAKVLIALAVVCALGERFVRAATIDARPAVGATVKVTDGKQSFVMSDGYATSVIHLTRFMPISAAVCRPRSCRQAPDGVPSTFVFSLPLEFCGRSL